MNNRFILTEDGDTLINIDHVVRFDIESELATHKNGSKTLTHSLHATLNDRDKTQIEIASINDWNPDLGYTHTALYSQAMHSILEKIAKDPTVPYFDMCDIIAEYEDSISIMISEQENAVSKSND